MIITSEIKEGILIIRPEGRLDAITSGEFEKETASLIQQSGKSVLIDFVKIDYLSSAGLRSLLLLQKEMKVRQQSLALCCLNETIREVILISKFDMIFDIFLSADEGLTFLNQE
jgi:anti-anti-sigma factor